MQYLTYALQQGGIINRFLVSETHTQPVRGEAVVIQKEANVWEGSVGAATHVNPVRETFVQQRKDRPLNPIQRSSKNRLEDQSSSTGQLISFQPVFPSTTRCSHFPASIPILRGSVQQQSPTSTHKSRGMSVAFSLSVEEPEFGLMKTWWLRLLRT